MRQSQTNESMIMPVEKPIVAVEGIDDFMRTVQTRMVYEYLLRRGYTHENGYNVLTTTGMSVIGNHFNGREIPRKNENLRRGLDPFFESEKPRGILIANGYKLSNFVYQTTERAKGNLEAYYYQFPKDITFLIDVSPEQAVDRMRKMKHGNGIPKPEYLEKIRRLYREYEKNPGVIRLDGQENEKYVFEEIEGHLKGLFPKIDKNRENVRI